MGKSKKKDRRNTGAAAINRARGHIREENKRREEKPSLRNKEDDLRGMNKSLTWTLPLIVKA